MEKVKGVGLNEGMIHPYEALDIILEDPNAQVSIIMEPEFINPSPSQFDAITTNRLTFVAAVSDSRQPTEQINLLHAKPDITDNQDAVVIEVEKNSLTAEDIFLRASQGHTYIRRNHFKRFEEIAKVLNAKDLSLLSNPEHSRQVIEKINALIQNIPEKDLRLAVMNKMIGSICFGNFNSSGRSSTHYH